MMVDQKSIPFNLQAPHIELGFYWHRKDPFLAYYDITQYFLSHGYHIVPPSALVKCERGELPREVLFNKYTFSRTLGRHESSPALSDLFKLDGWTPLTIRMSSAKADCVDLELTYAPIETTGHLTGSVRPVIEVLISGAYPDIVNNMGTQSVDATLLKEAETTERWLHSSFRCVCETFKPTYASWCWERALQPPEVFVREAGILDIEGFFLSDELVEASAELDNTYKDAIVERVSNGVIIGVLIDTPDDQRRALLEMIKNAMKSGLMA